MKKCPRDSAIEKTHFSGAASAEFSAAKRLSDVSSQIEREAFYSKFTANTYYFTPLVGISEEHRERPRALFQVHRSSGISKPSDCVFVVSRTEDANKGEASQSTEELSTEEPLEQTLYEKLLSGYALTQLRKQTQNSSWSLKQLSSSHR